MNDYRGRPVPKKTGGKRFNTQSSIQHNEVPTDRDHVWCLVGISSWPKLRSPPISIPPTRVRSTTSPTAIYAANRGATIYCNLIIYAVILTTNEPVEKMILTLYLDGLSYEN